MAWNKSLPTVSTVVSSSVTSIGANWLAITAFCSADHQRVNQSTSVHSAGECESLYVGTTAALAALTCAGCAMAWNTTTKDFYIYCSGGALPSSAMSALSAYTCPTNVGGFVPQGTLMLFYANTAPTGWTINTALNDKLVFITKGSAAGGQTGGGAHSTGTWSQLTHAHAVAAHTHGGATGSQAEQTVQLGESYFGTVTHTHTITSQAAFNTDANAIITAWRPAAYCYIVCTKS